MRTIGSPAGSTRTTVKVLSADPFSEAGVRTHLRTRPEIDLVVDDDPSDDPQVTVIGGRHRQRRRAGSAAPCPAHQHHSHRPHRGRLLGTGSARGRGLRGGGIRKSSTTLWPASPTSADRSARRPSSASTPWIRTAVPSAARRDLADAKTAGKKVRQENVPHGEHRYNCLNCRCDVCCTASTKGCARRRVAAQPEGPDGQSGVTGQVHESRRGTPARLG